MPNPRVRSSCSEKLKPKVSELQKILREHPETAQVVKDGLKNDPSINAFDVKYWWMRLNAFVDETNEFMQGHRVRCVSTDKNSDRMWKDYAQNDQDIVSRIEPSIAMASRLRSLP